MNITVYLIENFMMCLIFGGLVFGMLLKNPLSFISDYPPEIQERYYKSQHREATRERLTTLMIVKKIAALVVFLFVFAWMAHLAGAEGFLPALGAVYGYMIIVAAFDTFFLDWVLFAHIKKIRLPGTEDMEQEYRQKWFHVKVLFPMLPVFALGGLLCAFLTGWLWG